MELNQINEKTRLHKLDIEHELRMMVKYGLDPDNKKDLDEWMEARNFNGYGLADMINKKY